MGNEIFSVLKKRRITREVLVGGVGIGGGNPIRVQTMTNTDTLDVGATVSQIIECVRVGAELVRVTTPSVKHVEAIGEIRENLKKKGILVPIVADVHFLPEAALLALDYADKVRLNPGNLLDKKLNEFKEYSEEEYDIELKRIEDGLGEFIKKAKKTGTPIRLGANHGSLSDRVIARYGNTTLGMVESALEYLRIFKRNDFNNIVVALKASDPLIMIEANRMLVDSFSKENMDYPIHLGVTEAGNAIDGRAKSIVGISNLLLDGIGDTLRVSLTEAPEKEIPVCYSILQATRTRITKTEFVSCPSCGRTQYNIEEVSNRIKEEMGHLKGVTIAIMGCVVNGLGELGEADFGYVGGRPGFINLYYKKNLVKSGIPEGEAIEELRGLIKSKGKWVEKE